MNESSSILVSEIADLRQHLAAAVQEVSDTHYACDEKLLAAQDMCSNWVDKYRRAMAERDKVQCDLTHAKFDRDAALNLVESAEERVKRAEAALETAKRELAATIKAKQENDERYMIERDEALAMVKTLKERGETATPLEYVKRAEAAESRAQSEIEMRKSADNQARLAEARAREVEAKLMTTEDPDWRPGPCVMCGSKATYDGVDHQVTCDKPECGHWYQDKGSGHEAVIRHWNRTPHLEYVLAVQRAEKAEEQASLAEGRARDAEECAQVSKLCEEEMRRKWLAHEESEPLKWAEERQELESKVLLAAAEAAEATMLLQEYCDGCPARACGQMKENCPKCGVGNFFKSPGPSSAILAVVDAARAVADDYIAPSSLILSLRKALRAIDGPELGGEECQTDI